MREVMEFKLLEAGVHPEFLRQASDDEVQRKWIIFQEIKDLEYEKQMEQRGNR